MSMTRLQMTYATTDGQQFTDIAVARRHQGRLDAIHELADQLHTKFDLEVVVGVNIIALMAEQPELLMKAVGRVYRKGKDEAGNTGDTDTGSTPADGDGAPQ